MRKKGLKGLMSLCLSVCMICLPVSAQAQELNSEVIQDGETNKDLNFVTVFINPNTGKLVDIQHINYFYEYATGSNSMSFTRPYSSYTKYYYPYYNGEEPFTW